MKAKVLLLLVFILLSSCKQQIKANNLEKLQEASFVRVVDGDTIVVSIGGIEEKVRLIGVDTPESRINKRAHLQEKDLGKDVESIVDLGKKAKDYTKSQLNGFDKVYLEFDVQKRDKYGRILAYVYLPNGQMLNMKIICDGYAMPLTIPPNVKYEREFRECFEKATKEKKGLWNE